MEEKFELETHVIRENGECFIYSILYVPPGDEEGKAMAYRIAEEMCVIITENDDGSVVTAWKVGV